MTTRERSRWDTTISTPRTKAKAIVRPSHEGLVPHIFVSAITEMIDSHASAALKFRLFSSGIKVISFLCALRSRNEGRHTELFETSCQANLCSPFSLFACPSEPRTRSRFPCPHEFQPKPTNKPRALGQDRTPSKTTPCVQIPSTIAFSVLLGRIAFETSSRFGA